MACFENKLAFFIIIIRMSYITAIGTAVPHNRISQSVIADFMVKAMSLDYVGGRKLKAIFRSSGIEFRHSVLEDYQRQCDFTFYPNTEDFEPFPSTGRRLEVFREHALVLSLDAIGEVFKQRKPDPASITHLIVVCCTGMYAPGLDIEITKALKLSSSVKRTCINFMGCYAAFNALKIGDAVCAADVSAKVLIVCTELCSLHFQKEPTDDNLLANALFADGSAALLMESSMEDAPVSLRTLNFHNDLAMEGERDMAWRIGDLGFEMKLSSYVPDVIKRGIGQLTCKLLESLQVKLNDIRFFAIHPGGKKILEVIETQLCLSKEQNGVAYQVLRNYGNMSSATVLFVMKEILSNIRASDHGAFVLSFAFGPGLTLESGFFEININAHA